MPIPIPKSRKLIRLLMKDVVEEEIANSIARLAGLQGSTISPKNSPKSKASHNGFSFIGELNLGKIFPMFMLNIISRLIIARIPNAIGLMIPIALVRDSCKKKVKISPKINIEIITPNVTIKPRRM